MTNASDTESLRAELDQLTAWRAANLDKLGTPEFRRATLAHALLTDLVRQSGGTPEQQAYVAQKLKEIEDGTHPDSIKPVLHQTPLAVDREGHAPPALPDVVRRTAVSETSQVSLYVLPVHRQRALARHEGERSGFLGRCRSNRQSYPTGDAGAKTPTRRRLVGPSGLRSA